MPYKDWVEAGNEDHDGNPVPGARLVEPPPVFVPHAGAASAPAVVPGGEVYTLPQWVVDLIDKLTHKQPTPTPTPTPVEPGLPAGAVVKALNVERAKHGLPALRDDQKCTDMANYWAIWMAHHSLLTHGDFPRRAKSVYPDRAMGEIAARGFADVTSLVAGWMGSPGHRANILGDFTAAGAGHGVAAGGTTYDAVDFVK